MTIFIVHKIDGAKNVRIRVHFDKLCNDAFAAAVGYQPIVNYRYLHLYFSCHGLVAGTVYVLRL